MPTRERIIARPAFRRISPPVFCIVCIVGISHRASGQTAHASPTAERADHAHSALDERLQPNFPDTRFDNVAFGDVIDRFREVSHQNIFVDWNMLEPAGITRTTPVTARLENLKFSAALDTILHSAGGNVPLGYSRDRSVLVISTRADLQTSPTPAAATRPPPVEGDVIPLLTRIAPPIRFENATLTDVLDFMRDSLHVDTVVDWPALEEAGIRRTTPVELRTEDMRVGQLLELVLRSVSTPSARVSYVYENGRAIVSIRPPPATAPAPHPPPP
jgi:hypothetical protein